jgi:hypothetical protein
LPSRIRRQLRMVATGRPPCAGPETALAPVSALAAPPLPRRPRLAPVAARHLPYVARTVRSAMMNAAQLANTATTGSLSPPACAA